MFYLHMRKEYSELSFVVADFTAVLHATFLVYTAGQEQKSFPQFLILCLNDMDNP